jgi:low temperature requirement protein LtrA
MLPLTTFATPLRLRCVAGAEAGRRVTWLELFFDLAFVAAVAQVGTPLASCSRFRRQPYPRWRW